MWNQTLEINLNVEPEEDDRPIALQKGTWNRHFVEIDEPWRMVMMTWTWRRMGPGGMAAWGSLMAHTLDVGWLEMLQGAVRLVNRWMSNGDKGARDIRRWWRYTFPPVFCVCVTH
jgi:hypothetical protein